MSIVTVDSPQTLPIHSDPEIMGGVPVFVGTRVPARTLFDYLADGNDLNEFLDNFPSVSREQAIKLLEYSAAALPGVHARPMMERWGKLEAKEDLIATKMATGRPQDLLDVQTLTSS